MTKSVYICSLICNAAVLLVLTAVRPEILSDDNKFLAGFVNQEFLAIAGVMLSITLASAAQIHLKLNEIEEKHGRVFLVRTRANVRSGAYFLIMLFLVGVLLVVAKPIIADRSWVQSAFNGAALFVLLWMTLVLTALTRLIFAIKPDLKD
jgi:uncharacterized membrane protein